MQGEGALQHQRGGSLTTFAFWPCEILNDYYFYRVLPGCWLIFFVSLARFRITSETRLCAYLCGHFQRGINEEERPTPHAGSTTPWAGGSWPESKGGSPLGTSIHFPLLPVRGCMWQAAHAPAAMPSYHGGPYPQIMIHNRALLCWLGRVFFKMATRKVFQMGLIPAGF